MTSVLAFVMAAGGYGGYKVYKNYQDYGVNFDGRLHEVSEVVDGDTLVLENNIRVRLLSIDAPELTDCYGEAAQKALAGLVLGQQVRLEKDQDATDQYGRLLRYAFVVSDDPKEGDLMVNKALVRQGAAEAVYLKPNKRYLSELQAAGREAESGKVGLWGTCSSERPIRQAQGREIGTETFDKECVIKGNVSANYTKDYFLPGCPNYKRVLVDERKGEAWFCTEAEAEAAGYQRSPGCANIQQFTE